MTTLNNTPIFETNNDTDDWIVVANDKFEALGSEREAKDLLDWVTLYAAETLVAVEILPPNSFKACKGWHGRSNVLISERKSTNLKDFFESEKIALNERKIYDEKLSDFQRLLGAKLLIKMGVAYKIKQIGADDNHCVYRLDRKKLILAYENSRTTSFERLAIKAWSKIKTTFINYKPIKKGNYHE